MPVVTSQGQWSLTFALSHAATALSMPATTACIHVQTFALQSTATSTHVEWQLPHQHISCRYCGSGEPFDNIYVERDIATWEDLDERLRRMEHFIQNPPGPPLRLVVIDSVAHLFSDNADFQTGRSLQHLCFLSHH